jgi:hypothetical protein
MSELRVARPYTDTSQVERILKQQRAERQAAAEAALASRPQSTALVSDTASAGSMPGGFEKEKPPPAVPVASKPLPQILPPPPAPVASSSLTGPAESTGTLVDDSTPDEPQGRGARPNSMISQFNKLKNKFQKGPQGGEMPGSGLLPSGGSGPAANPGGLVTPLTNISTFCHFLVAFPLI